MATWSSQSSFATAVTSLVGDARHAAVALATPSSTGDDLHTVCGVLELESEQANASLPTPDSQTTNLLAKAYNSLGDGASECYHAAGNRAKQATALRYLSAGVAALYEAKARVAILVVAP